jgi:hypothetical protein
VPGGGVHTGLRSSLDTSIPSSESKEATLARRASEMLSAREALRACGLGHEHPPPASSAAPLRGEPGVRGVPGVMGGRPGVDGEDGGRSVLDPEASGDNDRPRATIRGDGARTAGARVS